MPDPHRQLRFALGRYTLDERIGLGGMAEVFRASSPDHDGPIVVKRLRYDRAADESMNSMFIDEARLAVGLHHPNIVRVYELGQGEDGALYMAMEYVEGLDLKQLLRAAQECGMRLPVWFSIWLVAEVLGALEYVHGLTTPDRQPRRVIHRDISPENILVSLEGQIKLLDFGVAKYDRRMTRTAEGRIKGKLCYMSPEQIRNRAIDERTDVFATGAVLWECLTQRRLFRGDSPFDVLQRICAGVRPPPSTLRGDVPVALDACVLAALEADANERTPTARAFRQEILRILGRIHGPVAHDDITALIHELGEAHQRNASLSSVGTGAEDSDFLIHTGSTTQVMVPDFE
ncbi:MAG: serine/threonine protein kinase [Deltaproteobacteria bacterium]|nr:serine/threonine protein kinase [Deltaproteobacteria bacterium]